MVTICLFHGGCLSKRLREREGEERKDRESEKERKKEIYRERDRQTGRE